MSMTEFIELIKESNVEIPGEINPDKTMAENGIDSLDLMLVKYAINEKTGRDFEVTKNSTPKVILSLSS